MVAEKLQNIKELVLECSSLQSLPDEFGNIANLEKLELRSCNNLTNVSAKCRYQSE